MVLGGCLMGEKREKRELNNFKFITTACQKATTAILEIQYKKIKNKTNDNNKYLEPGPGPGEPALHQNIVQTLKRKMFN